MGRPSEPEGRVSGGVVIDKPRGMSSRTAAMTVARRLGVRRAGHAGTLDPLATGVLVVMLGEATKLAPFLSADDKSYEARIELGRSTDTLDSEGVTTRQEALPSWWCDPDADERIAAALARERARREQLPPAFSAIKIAGRAAYARARAGEQVDLAPRAVAVRELTLLERDQDMGCLVVALTVSKGYYVRALARDLGETLGLPAHLSGLRRTASGTFVLSRAASLDGDLAASTLDLATAATTVLPRAELSAAGVERARHGKRLGPADFTIEPAAEGASAGLDARGTLVAIGSRRDDGFAILRGFVARGDDSS
jgi:tRNA pseudouridine55 synthase